MSKNTIIFEPPLIAHRGASLYAPENTILAFRKAKECGLAWVEFDVMLTQDRVPIVIHDERVDRTTNGTGWVRELPYSNIQNLDAGGWFANEFCGEKIPTLKQVLLMLEELNLSANIEIKSSVNQEEETVLKVIEEIKNNLNYHSQILISSFSVSILRLVKSHGPSLNLGYLMDEWNDSWNETCNELGCLSINVKQEILNPARIVEIKNTGILLLAYTVNNEIRAHELFRQGVDAIFTDNPLMSYSL